MEILSPGREQNQVQEPTRGTVRGDGAESGQLLLVANVEAFTRANTWSGSKQETARSTCAGKRSLEIQHYLSAMRDWIGEREMRTENRRL